MKYGFIGFGNLAKAIWTGLKDDKDIEFAYTDKTNNLEEIKSFGNISLLVSFSDVIWLCIKPQNLNEVLEELKNFNQKE